MKIQTIYNDFLKIFNTLGCLLTASSTVHVVYSYTCICWLVIEDFVVEIHHGHFHFFVNVFFFNFVYRSYNVFPGTSKTLKNGGFFSCLSSIVIVVFFFTYSSYKIWVCRIKLFPPFFKHSKFEQVEVERAYYFTLTIECWYVLKIWVHP